MVTTTKKTGNKVFLDAHGYIVSVYHGRQTAAGLQRVIDRMMKIMQRLIDKDKPVMVLADIRDMGDYDKSAPVVDLHARTVLPFWKMAVVTSGTLPASEKISRGLTSMSGRKKEIRYFRREDDAIGWLSFMR